MKIAVTDANIFIDLIHCALLEMLFGIGVEVHTTINVIDELNEKQQTILTKYIRKNLLAVHQLEEFVIPLELKVSKRLSDSDKSVFSLALQLEAFILTGDGVIRKTSGFQKIEVHGVLWLFDQFTEQKLITKKVALAQLKLLMDYNKRLPTEECEKRMALWK